MRYLMILAVVLLTGCSMFAKKEADFSCPKTGFVADADMVTTPDGKATAVINGFTGACSFKNPEIVRVELTLPFAARKNSADAPKKITLPYFVAVLSPDDEILQRQAFSVEIAFDEKTGVGTEEEEHLIKIPLTTQEESYKYKIVAGFSLTPEQYKNAQLKHSKEQK